MVNLRCKLCALILSANLGLHLAAIFIELGKKEREGTEAKAEAKKKGRQTGQSLGSGNAEVIRELCQTDFSE